MLWFGRKREPQEPLPPVIAPEVVGNGQGRYLDRVLDESRRVLDAPLSSFRELESFSSSRDGTSWSVHTRPVEGTKLTMVRLEAEVPLRADTLFRLLRTMDGKGVIDPFPREHHSEPVKPLRLPGGEAAVVFSEAPRFAGMLRPREYVTCDAEATRERLFVCKSCEVAEGPHATTRKGAVRANLLFAMRMEDAPGRPGRAHLQMINWLDLGANTVPPLVANAVTERWYMQGVVHRLRKYTAAHHITADTKPSDLAALQQSKAAGS